MKRTILTISLTSGEVALVHVATQEEVEEFLEAELLSLAAHKITGGFVARIPWSVAAGCLMVIGSMVSIDRIPIPIGAAPASNLTIEQHDLLRKTRMWNWPLDKVSGWNVEMVDV